MTDNESNVICTNCHKSISSAILFLHESYCFKNIIKCEKCSEMIDKSLLDEHNDEKHKILTCKYCQLPYEIQDLKQHENICHNKPRTCPYCNCPIKTEQFDMHVYTCGSRTKKCMICNKNILLNIYDEHEQQCLLQEQYKGYNGLDFSNSGFDISGSGDGSGYRDMQIEDEMYFNDLEEYNRSNQYPQFNRSGQPGRSNRNNQYGHFGQYGKPGQHTQPAQRTQLGHYSQPSQHAQPGHYSQSSQHLQPTQNLQPTQHPQPKQHPQPDHYSQASQHTQPLGDHNSTANAINYDDDLKYAMELNKQLNENSNNYHDDGNDEDNDDSIEHDEDWVEYSNSTQRPAESRRKTHNSKAQPKKEKDPKTTTKEKASSKTKVEINFRDKQFPKKTHSIDDEDPDWRYPSIQTKPGRIIETRHRANLDVDINMDTETNHLEEESNSNSNELAKSAGPIKPALDHQLKKARYDPIELNDQVDALNKRKRLVKLNDLDKHEKTQSQPVQASNTRNNDHIKNSNQVQTRARNKQNALVVGSMESKANLIDAKTTQSDDSTASATLNTMIQGGRITRNNTKRMKGTGTGTGTGTGAGANDML